MASLTKLTRQLLRWERYADRTCWSVRIKPELWRLAMAERAGKRPRGPVTPGHTRAWEALESERQRRTNLLAQRWTPEAIGRLWWAIEHDLGCCLAGGEGHDGPCVRQCPECFGTGICPHCDSNDDLGCHECGGSGCPRSCDAGQLVDL